MNTTTMTATNSSTHSLVTKITANSHWFLRFGLASVFLFHGIGKFAGLNAFSEMMGLPVIIVLAVALAEVGGALLLIAGGFGRDILTRLGALVFVPVLIGAIVMVHAPQWSFVATESHPMGGMEFQVVLTMISLYFVFKGNNA